MQPLYLKKSEMEYLKSLLKARKHPYADKIIRKIELPLNVIHKNEHKGNDNGRR